MVSWDEQLKCSQCSNLIFRFLFKLSDITYQNTAVALKMSRTVTMADFAYSSYSKCLQPTQSPRELRVAQMPGRRLELMWHSHAF